MLHYTRMLTILTGSSQTSLISTSTMMRMMVIISPTHLRAALQLLILLKIAQNEGKATQAQLMSQLVATVREERTETVVNEYSISSDSSVTTPTLSFSDLFKQRLAGNNVEQCPCVTLPGSSKCISYDARFQAATVEEAMLTFVDTSMDERIYESRLPGGGPIRPTTLECSTEECRQCVGMLALRLRQVGLVQVRPPPAKVPTFLGELISAAAPLRHTFEQSSTRSSFSMAVERALWESRESGSQPLISRFIAEVEGRVSSTTRVVTSNRSPSVASWSSWSSSWHSSSSSSSSSTLPAQRVSQTSQPAMLGNQQMPGVASDILSTPAQMSSTQASSVTPASPNLNAATPSPITPPTRPSSEAAVPQFQPQAQPQFTSKAERSAPSAQQFQRILYPAQSASSETTLGRSRTSPRSSRQAHKGEHVIGKRFVINCVERGQAENEETEFVNLCTMCWTWRQLPDEYFPRLLNELVCQENDFCLSGWGSCRQRYRNVDILKKVGSDWKPTTISTATCCDCKVKAGSELHSLVVGKNKN